jgi:hypothetical protein
VDGLLNTERENERIVLGIRWKVMARARTAISAASSALRAAWSTPTSSTPSKRGWSR